MAEYARYAGGPAVPSIEKKYGKPPHFIDVYDLENEWTEFMHYLYLPVRIPARDDYGLSARPTQWNVPPRLQFLDPIIGRCLDDAKRATDHLDDPYVYVTARRGYATPGNPLNRPGWHCDDFGGTDLNYIWSDRYPTRVLLADPRVMLAGGLPISADDKQSMQDMERAADLAADFGIRARIEDLARNTVYRLDPYVIHDTPLIPSPGGMRSFFKISVSTHRYNLIGNSRNHDLDYYDRWEWIDRQALRNQPNGNKDYA